MRLSGSPVWFARELGDTACEILPVEIAEPDQILELLVRVHWLVSMRLSTMARCDKNTCLTIPMLLVTRRDFVTETGPQ